MKPQIETVPDVREVFDGETLQSLSQMLETRIALTDAIKQFEEQKKELDAKITTTMADAGVPKVQYDGRSVSLVQGSRSSLSKEKLLLAGVAATVIQAATEETRYSYLLIGRAK